MTKEEMSEELKEVRKKVMKRDLSIFILGTPGHIKDRFLKLANDEFMGDFGFTLKHLVDHYEGSLTLVNEALKAELDDQANAIKLLAKEVAVLKAQAPKEKNNERKMIDGRTTLKVGE